MPRPAKSKRRTIASIFAEGTPIDEAIQAGVDEALRRHKQAGVPIVVWENGKVVWIPASRIKVKRRPKAGSPRSSATR